MTLMVWLILIIIICIALVVYSMEKEVILLNKKYSLETTPAFIPDTHELHIQTHIAAVDNWHKTIEEENDQIKARKTGRILQGTTKTPKKRTKKKRSRNKTASKGIRVPAKQKSKKH